MVTLSELSIDNLKRVLASSIVVMKKGLETFESQPDVLAELPNLQLIEDMAPLSTQVKFVRHHSLNAIHGLKRGEFNPPEPLEDLDYVGLINILEEALVELEAFDRAEIDALEGKPVYFRMTDFELPFTAENFIQSFSIPNVHFHSSVLYSLLRMKGVNVGKIDYLGQMNLSK